MTAPDENQTDLFAPPGSVPADSVEGASATSLTIPCGYLDRRNAPCRRLANRPVLIDGHQFMNRGRPLLHCDPACFRGESATTAEEPPPNNDR